MTTKEIIDGLKFTIEMFLLDPSTNETRTKESLNDLDRITVEACEGAIELLSCSEIPNSSENHSAGVSKMMDGDMISRRAAIAAMRTCYDTELKEYDNGDEFISYAQAVGELKNLSSVSGGGWIPCSEQMPEMPKEQEYYFFDGKAIAADEYIVMIKGAVIPTTLYWTGNEWFDPYSSDDGTYNYNVIAWMPLPEPYREGKDE